MDKKLSIVWLPGWFPSKVDFLPGDFIERHAKAASSLMNIVVLFVIKDTSVNAKKCIEIEGLNNLIIYRGYYTCTTKLGIVSRIISVLRYYTLLLQLYKKAKVEHVQFDLVHVHIALKQGVVAILLKWKEKLPYVITEQNAWFMPAAKNFFSQSFFFKWMVKIIYTYASAVHVVSKSLGDELVKNQLIKNSFTVIPNVVNTQVFCRDEKIATPFLSVNFIAITSNTYHKNTDGMLRAFSIFIKNGFDATLHIAGPNIEGLEELTIALGISTKVIFYGAITNEAVAALTKKCNAMIFFTRYETFGCVMAEALCCGVPVIASRLRVLEENLTEKENALFVTSEDENDLANKLIYFTKNQKMFDNVAIANKAYHKYNFAIIAQNFKAFYLSIN